MAATRNYQTTRVAKQCKFIAERVKISGNIGKKRDLESINENKTEKENRQE